MISLARMSREAAEAVIKQKPDIAAVVNPKDEGIFYLLFHQQQDHFRVALPWKPGAPTTDGHYFLFVEQEESWGGRYEIVYAQVSAEDKEWWLMEVCPDRDGLQEEGFPLDQIVCHFREPTFEAVPADYADAYVKRKLKAGTLTYIGKDLPISATCAGRLKTATHLKELCVNLDIVKDSLNDIVRLPALKQLTVLADGLSEKQCEVLATFKGSLTIVPSNELLTFRGLSDAGARMLIKKKGDLHLEPGGLSDSVVQILRQHPSISKAAEKS